jgi:hypothetical protein
MVQMRYRNRASQTNYDQLVASSAAVFQTEVGSESFYSGWIQQPVNLSVWINLLLGPAILGIFIVFLVLQIVLGQWSWVQLGLAVVFSLSALPSIWNMVQLLRNRNHATVMCWGWLSETELIYGSGVHVTKIPITSMKYIGRNSETLQFQHANEASLFLFRNLFRDTSHFDKISASFERLTTEG